MLPVRIKWRDPNHGQHRFFSILLEPFPRYPASTFASTFNRPEIVIAALDI
jgi:hypothetical protein